MRTILLITLSIMLFGCSSNQAPVRGLDASSQQRTDVNKLMIAMLLQERLAVPLQRPQC